MTYVNMIPNILIDAISIYIYIHLSSCSPIIFKILGHKPAGSRGDWVSGVLQKSREYRTCYLVSLKGG